MDKIPHVRTGADTPPSSQCSGSTAMNMAWISITDPGTIAIIEGNSYAGTCVCLFERLRQHMSNRCSLTTVI